MAIDKNAVAKEAQKFAAKGQFDKAIAEWKKLIRESPNDPNIYNTIGDLCLKKNSKAEAVDAYKRAADILAQDGFTSKAIALYKKVLNIDPSKVEVHLALGGMNAEKGLVGNAIESYKIAADHYKKHNQMDKALGIYQKMADLNPSNVAFRIKLADMYAKEDMKPEAAKAYLAAADVHVSKNAFKDARQLFEKVLSLDPTNKEVYHKAGIVYLKEGKFVEACKALKPALENDPSNQELMNAYLDASSKAGKGAEAEEALKKILDKNPGKTELHEKLYNLYLAKKDYENALSEVSVLADAKTESGATDAAEEILDAFVKECPQFAAGRKKLGEFYFSVNRPNDAANELLQAAALLAEDGDLDGAKAALNRALEIVPDMPEAREHLERLEAAAAPPPEPEESAAPQPERVIEQQSAAPGPSAAASEQPPVASTLLEEASEPPSAAPEPQVAAFEPPPASPREATVSEEDPAVTEALTEADVLIKYGLTNKALEQLEALTGRFPKNSSLRIKLRDLYFEQGSIDKAVSHALLAADLYAKRGAHEQAEAVLNAVRKIAPTHPAILILSRMGKSAGAPAAAPLPQKAPAAPAKPVFEEAGGPSLDADAFPAVQPRELAEDRFETESAPHATPPETIEEPLPAYEPPPASDNAVFDGFDAGLPPLEDAAFAEPPAPGVPAAKTQSTWAQAPTTQGGPASAGGDISEIWAEAEFYFQQGLFDEAKKQYARIIELTPGDKRAISRLSEITREEEDTQEFSKLAEAVDDLETAMAPDKAANEMAMTSSDQDAVRSLMQEIQMLKQQGKTSPAEEEAGSPPLPPRRKAPPKPQPPRVERETFGKTVPPPQPVEKEEDFFDLGEEIQRESSASAPKTDNKPDDFFDLAAELRDELNNVAVPAPSAMPAEEQSLDEVFEEFKKGIEQQTQKEDTDTHYNLGVAYKEMGLLDDAIAEFGMTPEDEPKFIQSRYMLGLCYMEKGEYSNAIGEIQNALDYSENMGIDTQHRIEMHYDLGLACQGAGNNERALNEFRIVYGIDREYRDAAAKINELQQGGFISLDQLKDDIEKEISSKFLEEGVRIEREEKTRKNEKVKR